VAFLELYWYPTLTANAAKYTCDLQQEEISIMWGDMKAYRNTQQGAEDMDGRLHARFNEYNQIARDFFARCGSFGETLPPWNNFEDRKTYVLEPLNGTG
jgi:hypothetical protein